MLQIRPYHSSDLPHLREICLLTGDSGRDGTAVYSDRKLVGDYFATPYAAYNPAQCLVLADELGLSGYVLGATDTRAYLEWFNHTWLPPLRESYRDIQPRPGAGDAWLFDLMRRDASAPEWVDEYPAHLHIDLLPRAQGKGMGRRLFEAWMAIASKAGAGGMHLGVARANSHAVQFYEYMGMQRHEEIGDTIFYVLKLPRA